MLISTIAAVVLFLGTVLVAGRMNSHRQAARIPVRIRDHRSKRF